MTVRVQESTPDGVEIITREGAVAPHPHPRHGGRLVPFRRVNRVLLADDRVLFECDDCGRLFENVRSVPAHISATHTDRAGSPYPEDVLRFVLREVRRHQLDHSHASRQESYQHVVELCNTRGLRTAHGREFTLDVVRGIYGNWSGRLRVHVRHSVNGHGTAGEPPTDEPTTPASVVTSDDIDRSSHAQVVADAVARLGRAAAEAAALFEQFASELTDLRDDVERLTALAPDPVVAEKAAAYDELRETYRRLGVL